MTGAKEKLKKILLNSKKENLQYFINISFEKINSSFLLL